MGRSICDPHYIYQPLSEERKAKMRAAAQKRLGIPEGYCKIYGVLVPIELRRIVWPIAHRLRRELLKQLIAELEKEGPAG